MRIEGGQESENVEDRRGLRPVAAGGGVLALVVMAVAYLVTGDANVAKKAGQVAGQVQGGGGQMEKVGPPGDPEDLKFARQVIGLTEAVWGEQFPQHYREEYQHPKMVLFSERVDSEGCGVAPSAVGPFYCPASKKVFLDPTFFEELSSKLRGSKADFSKAYVIAHEVGHHVQNLLGYSEKVRRFEQSEGKNGGVRLELQADYLAGVWAKLAQQKGLVLERGDLDEAITTANAIGDDRIANASGRGWVSPESFTHGTAAQRVKAFTKGFQSGDASKPALDYYFNPRANPLEL
jgi:predicted metalloprotease